MKHLLNKETITLKCRILGVPITASLTDLKKAHHRLARLYHPDKNLDTTPEKRQIIEERFKIIQGAYDFLREHYEAIQSLFTQVIQYPLTTLGSRQNRSYWIYSAVATL